MSRIRGTMFKVSKRPKSNIDKAVQWSPVRGKCIYVFQSNGLCKVLNSSSDMCRSHNGFCLHEELCSQSLFFSLNLLLFSPFPFCHLLHLHPAVLEPDFHLEKKQRENLSLLTFIFCLTKCMYRTNPLDHSILPVRTIPLPQFVRKSLAANQPAGE